MKTLLLYLWQLPQNLIGFIWTRFSQKYEIIPGYTVYFIPCFKAGVSLGQYIILDPIYKQFDINSLINTVKHEYGHKIQSKYLGWLYLPLVGIPSVCNNIWDRLFHKKWDNAKREKWYYSKYPEKWADKLGGVNRDLL